MTQTLKRPTFFSSRSFTSMTVAFVVIASQLSSLLISADAFATTDGFGQLTQITGNKNYVRGADWSSVAASADGTKIIVGTNGGYLSTSSDTGATWTEHTDTDKHLWVDVASSADGTKLVAVGTGTESDQYSGYDGFVYTSSDSGATWTHRTSIPNQFWRTVASSTDGNVLVVLALYGYVYRSADAGNTWVQQVNLNVPWNALASSADGTKLAATAYGGGLYTSDDSGVTWTPQYSISSPDQWLSIVSSADGTKLMAITQYNHSYTSDDSGATWTQRPINSYYVASSADGDTLIAGAGGRLFSSNTRGSFWTELARLPTSIGFNLLLTTSADGNTVIVGVNGPKGPEFYVSDDGGATWMERLSAQTKQWTSVAPSTDGSRLAATTSDGYIYTSSDGGATWVERINAGRRYWNFITSSADGSKLAATTIAGYIYTSSDGGATWVEQIDAGERYWSSIASSADGSKLAATVGGGYIYTSSDGGATWVERTDLGENYWISIASSADGNKLVTLANGGLIYTSSDSGASWEERESAGERYWNGVTSSADGSKLVAVSSDGSIYGSSDSGVTWVEQLTIDGKYWMFAASSSNGNRIAVTADFGPIYVSYDAGATWTPQIGGDDDSLNIIALSADGSQLITGETNGYLYSSSFEYQPPTLGITPSDSQSATPPTSTDINAPQTITNTQPTFSGTAVPFSTITITVHSDPIVCTTTADAQGNWSCTLPSNIPPGVHTIIVEITNPDTDETTTLGPYYIQVLGTGPITIDPTTPLAPNTGITPNMTASVNQSAALESFDTIALIALLAALTWFGKALLYKRQS